MQQKQTRPVYREHSEIAWDNSSVTITYMKGDRIMYLILQTNEILTYLYLQGLICETYEGGILEEAIVVYIHETVPQDPNAEHQKDEVVMSLDEFLRDMGDGGWQLLVDYHEQLIAEGKEVSSC